MSPIDDLADQGIALPKKRWRWPIWVVLPAVFGTLSVITAGAAGLGFLLAALYNTGELTADVGRSELERLNNAVQAQLGPAADQANFLAGYVALGHVDPRDDQRMQDLLLGSLAAIRQLSAVAFIDPDMRTTWATAESDGERYRAKTEDLSHIAQLRNMVREAEERKAPFWSAPLKLDHEPIVVAIHPVIRDQKFMGIVAAGVSLPLASKYMAEAVGDPDFTYFVITADGRVLLHEEMPALHEGNPAQADDNEPALKSLSEFPDPVLARLVWPAPREAHGPEEPPFQSTDVELADGRHVVVFDSIRNFGRVPWIIGFHFSETWFREFITSIKIAGLFALGMVAISLLIAFLLGRHIARPIHILAESSRRMAALDFSEHPNISTRLREIGIAAEAQAQMRNGLQWFANYIPKRLAPLLMRTAEELHSREADVVVLFSDIVGFAKIAEGRPPSQVAALLNRHFELLGEIIEEEGGTIDKFIGDSIMAFWGAPFDQPDRVERACRVARRIAARLAADNERRARKGLRPIRIRIGLHKGPALAGNIGTTGRVNYTLVGDTVNVAQALEEFGHELDDGRSDAIIVVSDEIAAEQLPGTSWRDLGQQTLPGRMAPISVFQMVME